MNPERIAPLAAKQLMSTASALLVATYDGAGFVANKLDGAICFGDFEKFRASMAKDRELIFY